MELTLKQKTAFGIGACLLYTLTLPTTSRV